MPRRGCRPAVQRNIPMPHDQTPYRGRPPTKFYELLRKHAEIIRGPTPQAASDRQQANRLGIDRSMYPRLVEFVNEHAAQIDRAIKTGNWTETEHMLFAPWGDYWTLPSCQALGVRQPAFPPQKPQPDRLEDPVPKLGAGDEYEIEIRIRSRRKKAGWFQGFWRKCL